MQACRRAAEAVAFAHLRKPSRSQSTTVDRLSRGGRALSRVICLGGLVALAVLAAGSITARAESPAEQTAPVAAKAPVRITSLNWPPYSGLALPEGGSFWQVIGGVMRSYGTRLEVDFFPWSRAVYLGLNSPGYVGYGPEYFAEDLPCLWSLPVGTSPVGFVQRRAEPITWQGIDDLSAYTIGVVQDYVNDGGPFDAALAQGAITGEVALDDLTNLRKVAAGRVDAAVIDVNVFHHLAAVSSPDLSDVLQMNERLLIVHDLHVCFAPTPAGRAARDRLNSALEKVN